MEGREGEREGGRQRETDGGDTRCGCGSHWLTWHWCRRYVRAGSCWWRSWQQMGRWRRGNSAGRTGGCIHGARLGGSEADPGCGEEGSEHRALGVPQPAVGVNDGQARVVVVWRWGLKLRSRHLFHFSSVSVLAPPLGPDHVSGGYMRRCRRHRCRRTAVVTGGGGRGRWWDIRWGDGGGN